MMNENENEVVATGDVTISDNVKGNRMHSAKTGEFIGKKGNTDAGANTKKYQKKVENSEIESLTGEDIKSFLPKMTLSGKPREFYDDMPEEKQDQVQQLYGEKYGEKIEEIARLAKEHDTLNLPNREKLRKKIFNEEIVRQLKLGPKKKERKATLILGLPAAGKSYLSKPLLTTGGAIEIDADNFKELIPEFKMEPNMVSGVHEESVMLSNRLLQNSAKKGYNLVIGKVGGSYHGIKEQLDLLEQNGYNVEIIFNDIPFDVSVERNMTRFDTGASKRLVPIGSIIKGDQGIRNTFAQALLHPAVKKGIIYSNDVKKGEKPLLLKEFNKN